MTKYQMLRQNLKELADSIRKSKAVCKQCQREHNGYDDGNYSIINKFKREFRHKHIAYSLLKGRSRDEIEHPAEDNKPDELYIKEIYDAYTEDVCVGS